MPTDIEQEITQLEKQIAEKRASLGGEKQASETALSPEATAGDVEPPEKEILHEVVGEKIQEQAPEYQPTQPSPRTTAGDAQPAPTQGQTDDLAPSYTDPALKDKVQELVDLAFNKSLKDAIKEASRLNNPALMDAFHDVLTDELYNALLERKKIEQVK